MMEKFAEIFLKVSMRLVSTEVLIIAAVFALSWGTEHIQLAIGGLLGYLAKEAVDVVTERPVVSD
jgi:hypothetical protein